MLAGLLASAALAETPLGVAVVRATAVEGMQIRSLSGEIAARDTLRAAFATGGRILTMNVDKGDRVQAGAPLAQLDAVQQEQALRAAEAGLATAEADLRKAETDLTRQEGLLARGATTRSARDGAEDALRIAQGGQAQARAERDRAKKALQDTVIRAPSNAVVIDRMAEPGQVIGAAQAVLELALGNDKDAIFDVPEVVLTFAHAPDVITLSPIDRPGVTFAGHIREVSPLIDAVKGTVKVTVAIDNAPADIGFNEAVRGTVRIAEPAHIALPYSVISATANGPAVWVVDPGSMTVSIRNVDILRHETGAVVLAGGVEPGEMVVTEGTQLLFPGRHVNVTEARP